MKKWEDIVKDMMEEPEGALPESVFAEFRARRTAGGAIPRKKRHPLVWAMAAAVAAGFATLLLLRKPVAPEEGVQVIQLSPAVQVQVDDTTDVVPPVTASPRIAQAMSPRFIRQPAIPEPEKVVPSAVPEETVPVIEPEKPDVPETEVVVTEDAPAKPTVDKHIIAESSPFIPQSTREKDVKVNVGSGAFVAVGGLAAILVTQLTGANAYSPDQVLVDATAVIHNTNHLVDEGSYLHRMPVIVGHSTRIPVTEKLGITTGLEYSLYTSQYTNPLLLGSKTQYVHYLGVPVRLDWVFVSGKWLEIYAGAGIKGDFCLGATIAGTTLGRDGPAFRMLGVSGIQFNVTSSLGIYVEPGISWTLPSERRILSTYSSEHPWMFSVAVGARFNLGN